MANHRSLYPTSLVPNSNLAEAVLAGVDPRTMHLVLDPGTLILAAVVEEHGTASRLLAALPLAFVHRAVLVLHHAVAMYLPPCPIADIDVSVLVLAHALAVLVSFEPVAVVDLAVSEDHTAHSIINIIAPPPVIYLASLVRFHSLALALFFADEPLAGVSGALSVLN